LFDIFVIFLSSAPMRLIWFKQFSNFVLTSWFPAKSVDQFRVELSQFEQFTPTRFNKALVENEIFPFQTIIIKTNCIAFENKTFCNGNCSYFNIKLPIFKTCMLCYLENYNIVKKLSILAVRLFFKSLIMNHQNKKEMIFSFKGASTGNDDISFALFFLPNDAWPIVQIEIFEGGLKFGITKSQSFVICKTNF
jgi:hypothetical protein